MNTTSRRERGAERPGPARTRAAALLALALGGCIQGPWDYYPENPPPFRGVFATVYVLADRPLEHACFERVLDIAEERTQAFAWYDSAAVSVSGPFSGQSRTVELEPDPGMPNCFQGDTALRAERGGEYAMTARFVWDSAGTRAVSILKGTAHVPDSFSIRKTAAAPTLAVTGPIPADLRDLAFLLRLPEAIREPLLAEYGDTLIKMYNAQDTAGIDAYFEANGAAMASDLEGLLKENPQTAYREGDTLTYLTGRLNTLSHLFTSDRGPGVGAVLITQEFDSSGGRPETAFDSPLGLEPDTADFYFPGNARRLLIYPDAKGPRGWNLLDSMGVVNTWFFTGRNRLHFYGFEKAYYDFHSTVTQTQGGGGAADGDSRIRPKYNIEGGAGIIAGAVPASFDVYIKTDTATKVYPLYDAHVQDCGRKNRWIENANCREFLPRYCRTENWKPEICASDAIRICLDTAAADTSLGNLCDSAETRADTAQVRIGTQAYCIGNDFPADAACDAPRKDCLESRGSNACKQALWDYCLDRNWNAGGDPGACGPGLASYCHDRPRLSETLCRHADAWCDAHADSPLCK